MINCFNIVISVLLQARDKLMEENEKLKQKLHVKEEKNKLLKSQMGMVRKNTLTYILEQMDSLKKQLHTEV